MPEPLDQTEFYQRIIAKCSANADFKAKLLADPRSVLAATDLSVVVFH